MKHLPDLLTLQHRRPLFRMSVHSSVGLSTFMSKFDIYVKVSILINYKTKQPSNLAWNISLTSWLCDIGANFSIRLSVRLSVCPSLNSSFMSKFDIYVKVSILINYKTKQRSNLVWISPWRRKMAKIWLKIWLKVKENGIKKIKLAKMVAKEKEILVRTLYQVNNFLISQWKHMLWVLIRSASARRF